MRFTRYGRGMAALLTVAALVAAGCGDDDDEASSSDTEASGDEAFCDAAVDVDAAFLAASGEEGSPEDVEAAFQAAEESAPDEIADAVDVLTTEGRAMLEEAASAPETEGGPPPIPSDEFFTASAEVGDYLSENCGFETIDVTAREYEFSGIPDEAAAGTTVLTLTNDGTEFHEVALMQIAEGEDRSLEELLALPEEEVGSLVTEKAFVLAPPGAETYVTADLEAGRYVAICFVPVGATPEALESGAPLDESNGHFMHGMVAEFTAA